MKFHGSSFQSGAAAFFIEKVAHERLRSCFVAPVRVLPLTFRYPSSRAASHATVSHNGRWSASTLQLDVKTISAMASGGVRVFRLFASALCACGSPTMKKLLASCWANSVPHRHSALAVRASSSPRAYARCRPHSLEVEYPEASKRASTICREWFHAIVGQRQTPVGSGCERALELP